MCHKALSTADEIIKQDNVVGEIRVRRPACFTEEVFEAPYKNAAGIKKRGLNVSVPRLYL